MIEVVVSVAILGGVAVGLLLARNRALGAYAAANERLLCTSLCASKVAALRADAVGEGRGVTEIGLRRFEWRVRPVDLPAKAPEGLIAYEVQAWPMTGGSAEGEPPATEPDTEPPGASVTIWLPLRPDARKVRP